MSHLGRPGGQRVAKFSLAPVAKELGELLNKKVTFLGDCVGKEVEEHVRKATDGNTFGHGGFDRPGKFEVNQLGQVKLFFSRICVITLRRRAPRKSTKRRSRPTPRQLKRSARHSLLLEISTSVSLQSWELYEVNAKLTRLLDDAFGTAHRAHSSMVGIELPQKASGFLVKKELEYFAKALESPQRPFLAILGGAKVSDKIQLIDNLIPKIDILIICGGMAFTFKKTLEGVKIGNSLYDEAGAKTVGEIIEKAKKYGVKVVLPVDYITADEFAKDAKTGYATDKQGIPDGWMGLDCGEESTKLFKQTIGSAKTILWNG